MGKIFRPAPGQGIINKKIKNKISRLKRLLSLQVAHHRCGETAHHQAWMKNNHRRFYPQKNGSAPQNNGQIN
ncbi:MAG: hypothetical protein ACR5LG_02815 [Sodalis sp. (in: enterobacteria)]|uniref:hypothetical protein n=1 Tax=Sodalis sp. (in: enterobacteria) TaxID=1898979 RepID=UPI003F3F940A